MPKRSDTSDSETPSDSTSGSDDQNPQESGNVPEYEKQRQARIAHNKARMEALGLPQMASSLMGSAQKPTKRKRKGKAKVLENDDDDDDDDEYSPEEEDRASSSDDDVDYEHEGSPGVRKKKNKGAKPKKASSRRSSLSNSDYLDDDEALQQAIALSLQDSAVVDVVKANVNERKGENQKQQDTGRRRKKSQFASRLQMTEDELILHFFQFDERCSAGISVRDLERVAIAHDFIWSDKEVADMVHLFDSDGDGKLSLEDFRKIVVRCNMIKAPEN